MKKKELKIHKANELIEASYRLTTQEQRIILLMISMLNPYDEKEFQALRINIKNFIELVGVKGKSKYEEIFAITAKLRKRNLIIRKKDSELIIGWLSSAEYFKGQGYVELEFSPKMKPYLLQLKELYTPYSLKDVIQLKVSYSVRIYELCKQYQKFGERYFELEELKTILGIEKNKYKMYGDFKRRVLIPVVKELNKKTDLLIKLEQKKKSRKVIGIKFVFSHKKSKEKPLFEPKDTNPELYKKLTKYFCLSSVQAKAVMENYKEGRLKNNLAHVERRIKLNEIKNIGAYTLSAIQKNISDQESLFAKEEKEKEEAWRQKEAQKRFLEELDREYEKNRDEAAAEYEQSLQEDELERIKDIVDSETEERHGKTFGFEVLSRRAMRKKLAKLSGFPSREEWVAEEKKRKGTLPGV